MGAAPAWLKPIGPPPVSLASLGAVVRQRGVLGTVRRAYELASVGAALRHLGILHLLRGKTGLEIGGPSSMFARMGLVSAYAVARRVDNCTFADHTLWEGPIQAGLTFRFHPRRSPGRQFIGEATDLGAIATDAYDFVLSSNVIEHTANPLKALAEWRRVLKPGGLLVLVAPHRDATFDHRRPTTTLAHLIDDYERDTGEDDLTHLDEILALHDLSRDPEGGSPEAFRARSLRNIENRCLHHHVFDTALAAEMVRRANFRVVRADLPRPLDILVLAIKDQFAPQAMK